MNVLVIDSSVSLLGIGLKKGTSYHERNTDIGLHHTENLTSGIEEILKNADLQTSELDMIVVSKGPGSFTGLRIGMAVGKGIAFAAGIPLVSVPSLDVWCLGKEFFPGLVLPVIDARKQRVYTVFFENGKRSSEYLDISPTGLRGACESFDNILLTGPYAPQLLELWSSTGDKSSGSIHLDPQYGSPHTWELLQLGIREYERRGADGESDGPLYIRPSEAEAALREKNGNGRI